MDEEVNSMKTVKNLVYLDVASFFLQIIFIFLVYNEYRDAHFCHLFCACPSGAGLERAESWGKTDAFLYDCS